MPQYATVCSNSLISTSAGVVGIPVGDSESSQILLPSNTYFDIDPPVADSYAKLSKSSCILLTPANAATAVFDETHRAYPAPLSGALSSPRQKWTAYDSYPVGYTVWSQASAAAPFYGYTATSAIPASSTGANPLPSADMRWTVFPDNQYIVPWSSTAAYTTGPSLTYVSYKGLTYLCKLSLPANPFGNTTPDLDTTHYDVAPQTFRVTLSSGVAPAGGLLYSYLILNTPLLPDFTT